MTVSAVPAVGTVGTCGFDAGICVADPPVAVAADIRSKAVGTVLTVSAVPAVGTVGTCGFDAGICVADPPVAVDADVRSKAVGAVPAVSTVPALVAGEIVKGSQIAPGLFALIGVLPLDMGIGAAQLYLPAVLGTGADGGHIQPYQPAGIVGPVVAVILLIEHIQLCTA